jgi:hypothetical protein
VAETKPCSLKDPPPTILYSESGLGQSIAN